MTSTRSRPLQILQNVVLLLAGTVVGLLLVEWIARSLYDRPWYDHLADQQEQAETLDYVLNAFGLRGREFVSPKPPGTRRVYMAGDSFTFGMGVADASKVMPSLVEASLNDAPSIGEIGGGVEVLNGGMLRASLPRDWLRKWNQVADPYDPDVVLIVFFLRDGTNTGSIPAFFNVIREQITERNDLDPWYDRSFLYRLVRDRKDKDLVAGQYTERFRQAYFGSEQDQKEWRSAQYNMLELKASAEARGAVVGMVTYPILVDLAEGQDYPFQDICDLLAAFAREREIPLLELLPSFRGEHGPDLWVSPLDQHPNEKGHAIAADAITPFVAELLKQAEERAAARPAISMVMK